MKKIANKLVFLVSMFMLLTMVFSCFPSQTAQAAIAHLLGAELPTFDDQTILGDYGLLTCGTNGLTNRKLTLNGVALDAETMEPIPDVGLILDCIDIARTYRQADTTSAQMAAVFRDVPMSMMPSDYSIIDTPHSFYFAVTSVPRGYKHPHNATLDLDLYLDLPVKDLYEDLRAEGYSKWQATAISLAVQAGYSWIEVLEWIPSNLLIRAMTECIVPEAYRVPYEDELTGKVLPAKIFYRDYRFLNPADTRYWIGVRLERKYSDPLTIYVSQNRAGDQFELIGPNGENYPLTNSGTAENGDMILKTAADTPLPLGSYVLSVKDKEEEYPFYLEGIAFPTTIYGEPDYKAFRAMTSLEQSILADNDPVFYQKYYESDHTNDYSMFYNEHDNEWTMLQSYDYTGTLQVLNPLAVTGHELRLSEPSSQYWLSKVWNGKEPAEGEEITLRIGKTDKYGFARYLDTSLTSVSSEYLESNMRLISADDPCKVTLSADNALNVIREDGVTVWEAPLALPDSFTRNAKSIFIEETPVPAGRISVFASGQRVEFGGIIRPTLVLYNDSKVAEMRFRKLDMNGNKPKDLPEFVVEDTVPTQDASHSTRIPVAHSDDGIYRALLNFGRTYTLTETSTSSLYKGGAKWTVTVDTDGHVEITPQNEAAGNVRIGADGTKEVINKFQNPKFVRLTKEWTDLAGSPLEPPADVDGIRVHLEVSDNRTGESIESLDRVLTRENGWLETWYFNADDRLIDSTAVLTEGDWLNASGQVIERDPAWTLDSSKAQTTIVEHTQEATLTLRNYTSEAGLLKMDGTETGKDYRFVREWDQAEIVWNDAKQCYPLDLNGLSSSAGPYILDEYKGGSLLGKWQLSYSGGNITGATPIDFDGVDGKTKPVAEIDSITINGVSQMRLVLRNPVDSYTVKLRKEWDESFTAEGYDRRPSSVEFNLYPIGTGTSTADMQPIPGESASIAPVTVTITPNAPETTVTLMKNVIYRLTETLDDGSSSTPAKPYYSVTDKNGNRNTEWLLPAGDGTTVKVTSGECAVVTEKDESVLVRNTDTSFTVNLHIKNGGQNKPSYADIQLQKKENGVWKNVYRDRLFLRDNSGNFLTDESYTFRNIGNLLSIDKDGEYRARLLLNPADISSGATLAEENRSVTVPETHTINADGAGTVYSLTYDDSKCPMFVQEITLEPHPSMTVRVNWMDANNRDNIRPEKITVELLVEQGSNPENKWAPVTDRQGNPVTVELTDWKEENGIGWAEATVELAEQKNLDYRVRVTSGTREDNLVRFEEKKSLYSETYTDDPNKPQVTLTAMKEYKAVKKWDVDIENLDIPESVKMVLQKKPASGDSKDWGTPVQTITLESGKDWKGSFKPVSRYAYTEATGTDGQKAITWNEGEVSYRVREFKSAKLKGKLSEYLGSLEKSVLDSLKLPGFVKDYLEGKVPDNAETEKKVYDWLCTQSEDSPLGGLVKLMLKDNIPEKGGYITFDVPERYSVMGAKTVEAHSTKYYVESISVSGDTTTITNQAVEEINLWKLWVNIEHKDRPDYVFLVATSRFDSAFAENAASMGIPLVDDFTPVLRPIAGDMYKVPLIDWPLPVAIAKVNKPSDDANFFEKQAWNAHFTVKKYGETGIPQEFKGSELLSYIPSEAAKIFFSKFIGDISKVFDYAGFNFVDRFFSISTPALKMPDLIGEIGSSIGYDELEGFHSAIINTWIGFDFDFDHTIGGKKTWKDSNNADGIRPDSVTIHIFEQSSGGEVKEIATVKSSASKYWTWTYSSNKLDLTHKKYFITEDPIEGYTTTIKGFNITNTHDTLEPLKRSECEVTVRKNWGDDTTGAPDKLTVYLKKNGVVADHVDLAAPDWSHTFTGLALKDENNKEIVYSVSEDVIPGFRLESITSEKSEKEETIEEPDGLGGKRKVTVTTVSRIFTLNNVRDTVDEDNVLFRVNKVWQNDTPDQRPEEVQVWISSADGEINETLTLNAAGDWTACKEMPRKRYTVREVTNTEGYVCDVGPIETTITPYRITYTCTVTNSRVLSDPELHIVKEWEDEGHEDLRPDSVRLELLRDGEATGITVTLNSRNGWQDTVFAPLYADDGTPYFYTVRELDDSGRYRFSQRFTYSADTLVITARNKLVVPGEEARLRVTKVWKDDEPAEHDPLTIALYQNGVLWEYQQLEPDENGVWSKEWSVPYRDESGNVIAYSVAEIVPENYYCRVSPAETVIENGVTVYCFTISNSTEPLYGVVYQLYGDSAYGIPEGLTAPVDQNSYAYGATVTIAPKQTTAWETSNGKADGVRGEWHFDGWTRAAPMLTAKASDPESAPETFTITGDTVLEGRWTFVPRPYRFVFYKQWIDNKAEHEDPVFILYRADGSVMYGADAQPESDHMGKYTYYLPDDGEYYVQELPMNDYTTTYKNISSKAADRAYNNGTVINRLITVPKTGDRMQPAVIAVLMVLSALGGLFLGSMSIKKKRPRS